MFIFGMEINDFMEEAQEKMQECDPCTEPHHTQSRTRNSTNTRRKAGIKKALRRMKTAETWGYSGYNLGHYLSHAPLGPKRGFAGTWMGVDDTVSHQKRRLREQAAIRDLLNDNCPVDIEEDDTLMDTEEETAPQLVYTTDPVYDADDTAPFTNADRIRAMSDEELADFIKEQMYGDFPSGEYYSTSDVAWWLKQPAY